MTSDSLINGAGTNGHTQVVGPEQLASFQKNGFAVIPGFATPEECSALKARATELVRDFDPRQLSIFSTKDQNKTSDDYFLGSGHLIRFFFEEKAFDENKTLVKPKEVAINKIGHALHELDDVFRQWSFSSKVAEIARALGFRKPLVAQSMYIFKQPGIGGEVVPHQDSTFLHTDPTSCIGLWLAVEDATIANGCLWALPTPADGQPLKRRFVRNKDKGETGPATKFDPENADLSDWDQTRMVPVEVPQGTLVLLHGSMLHMSHENKSGKSRHAYSIHLIEGDGCVYSPDNWLQRPPEQPFPQLL